MLPPGDQLTFIQKYECTEPGQTHVARDGWKSLANTEVNCVRCGLRLFLDVSEGWHSYQPAYRIEEEPW